MMTSGGAYLMEMEDETGSVEVGKHADFIVLDRNLFEIAPETIDDTVVERTVFAGETVYRRH